MKAIGFKVIDNNGVAHLDSQMLDLGDINTDLSKMYSFLGCNTVEHANVQSPRTNRHYDIWVNENGMFENPRNFAFICNAYPIEIYGDIIVTHCHVDDEGNCIDDGLDPATVRDINTMVELAFSFMT